jgi:hypothetical protein
MRTWISCIVLLLAFIPVTKGVEDEFLISIARLVDSGRMPEKEALGVLQGLIDRAKKDVAAHKPVDPEKVKQLLQAENLEGNAEALISSGCTVDELKRVAMVRRGDAVTLTSAGDARRPERTFSLKSDDESDKRFQSLFADWQNIVTKIATAPPEAQWLSRTSPEELLKWGRKSRDLIGGTGFTVTSFSLEVGESKLAIEDKTGVCVDELVVWHRAITGLLVPIKRPAPGK